MSKDNPLYFLVVVHVDGRFAVRAVSGKRALRRFDDKQDAVAFALAQAAKHGVWVSVHKPDGMVERLLVPNPYRVPARQWSRWSPRQRVVFNDVFYTGGAQGMFKHVHAFDVPEDYWQVTRWNFAFEAACAAGRAP